jgi:hypothetical protein
MTSSTYQLLLDSDSRRTDSISNTHFRVPVGPSTIRGIKSARLSSIVFPNSWFTVAAVVSDTFIVDDGAGVTTSYVLAHGYYSLATLAVELSTQTGFTVSADSVQNTMAITFPTALYSIQECSFNAVVLNAITGVQGSSVVARPTLGGPDYITISSRSLGLSYSHTRRAHEDGLLAIVAATAPLHAFNHVTAKDADFPAVRFGAEGIDLREVDIRIGFPPEFVYDITARIQLVLSFEMARPLDN